MATAKKLNPDVQQTVEIQSTETYTRQVWRQFKKNRPALVGMWAIVVLTLIAIFADLLAGNKPYYIEYRGKTYFPAFRQYAVYLGIAQWPRELRRRKNFKRFSSFLQSPFS